MALSHAQHRAVDTQNSLPSRNPANSIPLKRNTASASKILVHPAQKSPRLIPSTPNLFQHTACRPAQTSPSNHAHPLVRRGISDANVAGRLILSRALIRSAGKSGRRLRCALNLARFSGSRRRLRSRNQIFSTRVDAIAQSPRRGSLIARLPGV